MEIPNHNSPILLKYHEVYDNATGKNKPPLATDADRVTKQTTFDKSDIKAQKAITLTIDKEPLLHIVNCNTAAEMWTKLKSVSA